MTTTSSTMTRPVQLRRSSDPALDRAIDVSDLDVADLATTADAPVSLADISCWRLLSARVPLTLLVDLALTEDEFDDLHEEMLAEPSSVDWIPGQRAGR
jgi:hypothetical protein